MGSGNGASRFSAPHRPKSQVVGCPRNTLATDEARLEPYDASNPSNGIGRDSFFLYTGQKAGDIPRDVTFVRVHPSIRVIGSKAFYNFHQLEKVELCEGLELIEKRAFFGCKLLKRIKIPSTVKMIDEWAFRGCVQLEEVELCKGLDTLGDSAFKGCKSLKHIKIPSTVKFICNEAFSHCDRLMSVDLHEGLQQIRVNAFHVCNSLKRIRIPSSVTVIGTNIFNGCERLEELELCEGVEEIEEGAFNGCKFLKYVRVPSTVKIIPGRSFQGCELLEDVDLCDGLEQIGSEAFAHCNSLKHIKIPSTVKRIGDGSFTYCKQLKGVELCEGLEDIADKAFIGCTSLKCIKIPPTVTSINMRLFQWCTQVISIELGGDIEWMAKHAFRGCASLRNVVVSSEVLSSSSFDGCHDLLKLFGSQENVRNTLTSRFDGLPVHKFCYHQSQYPTQVAFAQLAEVFGPVPNEGGALLSTSNPSENNQDCLGMTPLHILTCSAKQNLNLYQVIIANQPSSLITEDRWGCLPILYAIWRGAPQEVVEFVIDRQKYFFPDLVLNWDSMVETLCRAGASQDILLLLLEINQTSFPEQSINWQKAAREFLIWCLMKCDNFHDFSPTWRAMLEALGTSQAHQEFIESLLEMQQGYFPDENETELLLLCGAIANPVGDWPHHSALRAFSFFARYSISERLGAIGVKKWRTDYEIYMKKIAASANAYTMPRLETTPFDNLHSKLVTYEHKYHQLKEATLLLELVLWKIKNDESLPSMMSANMSKHDHSDDHPADMKEQCRISCGAEIIIPNVLPYLICSVGEDGQKKNGNKKSGPAGTAAMSGDRAFLVAMSGDRAFLDNQTFDRAYENVREEQLDVYAPAGRLGVVIDTPDDGAPVVHAVKDMSPIASNVQVGDKLVAVDDEDVRAMTAIKVSRLISRKSSNASRKLTIIRTYPI